MKQVYFRKICRELAKLSGVDVPIYAGHDYFLDYTDKVIYIQRIEAYESYTDIEQLIDKYFLESLMELTTPYSCVRLVPMPILSFLHELGHLHTATRELIDDYYKQEQIIYRFKREVKSDLETIQKMYFHIPIEVEASRWAVQFVEEHFYTIINLWNTYNTKV